ncbi:hydrogenase accessory protein HypB [bacterium]|nr:MAG: hydrogenase accessory protein HypB [bacterium]
MEKIKVLEKILSANDRIAENLRRELKEKRILLVNIMGSPGCGKTSVIERTIKEMKDLKFGVIEGDIETTMDSERLSSLGIPVSQINTGPFGGDCHLESAWVSGAFEKLNSEGLNIVFIENIGNLVCPAEFDTGAHVNVVVLSTPEGEDKPLKYPLMFRTSHVMLINKIDLAVYLDVRIEKMKENARKINPGLVVFEVSAKTGEGFSAWEEFLRDRWKNL